MVKAADGEAPSVLPCPPFAVRFRNMAMRSHTLDLREREQRQRDYLAAPLISEMFPGVAELAVRMAFKDPEGKEKPQPYAQVFAPDMRAFFQFQCPLRQCTGGGFDLSAAVPRLARKGSTSHGSLVCSGKRARTHGGSGPCGLQLDYEAATQAKKAHAA